MIHFFRKLRQELLNQNSRAGSYFLYAIGEIILVVVGILIALAVNNWNSERKDQRLGEDLLVRIHRDLVQDTLMFRENINNNAILRAEIKELLVNLYDGVDSIEEVQSMSATYDKALDQVFSPNDNTYKSMLSSGNLGLIRNPELKEEIVDLYSEYDQTRALLSSINDWMGGVAINVDTETDFIKFNIDAKDIYSTDEMLNDDDFAFLNDKQDPGFKIIVRAISATAFNQQVRTSYYIELIDRCDKLLGRIDQELKVNNRIINDL